MPSVSGPWGRRPHSIERVLCILGVRGGTVSSSVTTKGTSLVEKLPATFDEGPRPGARFFHLPLTEA